MEMVVRGDGRAMEMVVRGDGRGIETTARLDHAIASRHHCAQM
ncbi:MAG TPA: hypothetical protein VGF95_11970 [Solirubrobacteraceae bacterium]|jgi:hypothetical protein